MFHVERRDWKCCSAQAVGQGGAGDHDLRARALDDIDQRLLVSSIQLGSQVIQTQQWPMTSYLGVKLRLSQQTGQRNQLFLAT